VTETMQAAARGASGRAGPDRRPRAVGVIHRLGEAVSGYALGERVLVGAITPCGT
jgi:threonine dehydrogenase-like Zn-dependent dehydrogenase